jgi:2-amino-4-hydroxy-6-hydroxymethyldihydropteridine diphosphokinase
MTHTAYLSLGSNLGNREHYLDSGIARLAKLGKAIAISSFYETEPVEFTGQPWFLNCAVGLETTLGAEELLKQLMTIERELGRDRMREKKKGPRTMDMDILLFDEAILNLPDLQIPHPAMHQRRFVLEPLAEIAQEARHPLLKKSVHELLADLSQGQLVRRISKDKRPASSD